MSNEKRLRVIDLNYLEETYKRELSSTGNDAYTCGYIRGIKNILESLQSTDDTKELLSEVWEIGYVDYELVQKAKDFKERKESRINDLIK